MVVTSHVDRETGAACFVVSLQRETYLIFFSHSKREKTSRRALAVVNQPMATTSVRIYRYTA